MEFAKIVMELMSYDPIGSGSVPLTTGEYELGVLAYGDLMFANRAPCTNLADVLEPEVLRPTWSDLGLNEGATKVA